MAWNKANSNQIQDGAILSRHISTGVINETHLAAGAVKDTHIDIDWASKASTILATKKVVDYVQAPSGTVPAGSSTINLSGVITLSEAATDNDLGVIVSAPNNKVILTEKGDPSKLLVDGDTGAIIYGRINPGLEVAFFVILNGNETLYTFDEEKEYSLQFPARFTLETVSEMFAANEKFVDGAADVTTRLDVAQVVADVFGASYVLNKDGQATVAAGQTVIELIDAVKATADTNTADISAIELLLSGTEGNPASGLLTKVATAEGKVSTLETKVGTVEGTISTLESKVTNAENTVSVLETVVQTTEEKVSTLETSVSTLEASVSNVENTVSVLETVVQTAEASVSTLNGQNLDARLTTIEDADLITRIADIESAVVDGGTGTGTGTGSAIDVPRQYRIDKKADAQVTEYTLADLGVAGNTLPLSGTIDVYINGMLQMTGEHYTESLDGDGNAAGIVFTPNVVGIGDIVQLRWMR